jgi:hypothetical protein
MSGPLVSRTWQRHSAVARPPARTYSRHHSPLPSSHFRHRPRRSPKQPERPLYSFQARSLMCVDDSSDGTRRGWWVVVVHQPHQDTERGWSRGAAFYGVKWTCWRAYRGGGECGTRRFVAEQKAFSQRGGIPNAQLLATWKLRVRSIRVLVCPPCHRHTL